VSSRGICEDSVSRTDYVHVPDLPGLSVCVRPFARHSPTVGLCYVGQISQLIAAGVASLDMLTTRKRGVDAAGDRYAADGHWSTHAASSQLRYRIWRWMSRDRALQMPGAMQALAHAAAQARRRAARGHEVAAPGRDAQRQRMDSTRASASSAASACQNRSGARS
jgi:hypothetical protein